MKVKQVIAILEANGWQFARNGRGDHKIYVQADNPNIVNIDGKPSDEVDKGTLGKIRRASGIEELR